MDTARGTTPMTFENYRLDRARPLSEQVYSALRRMVLTGALKPGELIDEKAIAEQLNISRTPVREAVKRLRDEELVDVVAQSATRVSQLDAGLIQEAFLIRRALERESAAQASLKMNQAHADALAAIIERHMRSIRERQFAGAIEIDDEFHAYIAGISGYSRLWRTVEISKAQLDRCRHLLLPEFGQAKKTIEQHRAILRSLVSGNAAAAEKAMIDHLNFAFESALTLLQRADLSFPVARKPGGRQRKPS